MTLRLDSDHARSLFFEEILAQHHDMDSRVDGDDVIQRWKKFALMDDDSFARMRLAWSDSDFEKIIGWTEQNQWHADEPIPEKSPVWSQHLYPTLAEWADWQVEDEVAPEGLFRAYFPFVNRLMQHMKAAMPSSFQTQTHLMRSMAECLYQTCHFWSYRTLILELNVAREAGLLEGQTPEARFNSFIGQHLGQKQVWLAIFHEYPVLARLLDHRLTQQSQHLVRVLNRLDQDLPEIRQRFALDGDLLTVNWGLSDPHCGAQSVAQIQFQKGEDIQALYYKPRSLQLDLRFQAVVASVEQWVDFPNGRLLYRMECWDRGDYGWCESIPHLPCQNLQEVRDFYFRQGALLAVFHAVRGADFHYENLIARGAFPVPIDLESLAQNAMVIQAHGAAQPLAQWLTESVIRTGMLPQFIWSTGERPGINISALGEDGVQEMLMPQVDPLTLGTDQAKIAQQNIQMQPGMNLPLLEGKLHGAPRYQAQILAGFQQTYRAIAAHRDQLLASPNWQALFQCPVRNIMRPTRDYSLILKDGTHPDFLRDGSAREFLLDALWSLSAQNPAHQRLIEAEKSALRWGDIPIFYSKAEGTGLISGCGQRIESFFDQSLQGQMPEFLERWDEKDLARQVWLIKASLSALKREGFEPVPRRPASQPPTRQNLLDRATQLGERLLDIAFVAPESVGWLTLRPVHQRFQIGATGSDFYDGNAGIALFLACLGNACRDERYVRIAQQIYLNQLAHARTSPFGSLGIASELAGVIHLSLLAKQMGWGVDQTLLSELPEKFRHAIPLDREWDILSGSAGTLILALSLNRLQPSVSARRLAHTCATHLCAHAISQSQGLAWQGSHCQRPLLGFSHGAAGIAWALQAFLDSGIGPELHEQVAKCVQGAVRFEMAWFNLAGGDWPDLRQMGDDLNALAQSAHMKAWCHGAPGIALSRYLLDPQQRASAFTGQLEAAVGLTLAQPCLDNMSLCHGFLGNLWIVDYLGQKLGRSDWQATVRKQLEAGWDLLERDPPVCGLPMGLEVPSLFNGLAGIGLALLHFAGEQVPFPLHFNWMP